MKSISFNMKFIGFGFIGRNARWLAGGFGLIFFSSFGQTFFISLSAGGIRQEFDLGHGGFGSLYMAATLAGALALGFAGRITDSQSPGRMVLICVPMLALGCAMMSASSSLIGLFLSLFLLRLFGQGMMGHVAMTAIGRWFAANRARAAAAASIGVNVGEALMPSVFVAMAILVGWRGVWMAGAVALILLATPTLHWLMKKERQPQSKQEALHGIASEAKRRQWTRAEALRDPCFYLIQCGTLTLPFILTTIFFHQVYLVESRGWTLASFAALFPLISGVTLVSTLASGVLADRFSACRLLPAALPPLGIGCLVLAWTDGLWGAAIFMTLSGTCYGILSALYGALWPEIYGTRHLGAIRAAAMAALVVATATGPGLIGWMIDRAIPYDAILTSFGLYCLAATPVMMSVSKRLRARAAQETGTQEPKTLASQATGPSEPEATSDSGVNSGSEAESGAEQFTAERKPTKEES